jgi:WD40 repeat protein
MMKPIPFIEGLAVYQKYKHLGESRLNDSRTQMMIRQMVLDGRIPYFDEIKGFYTRREWPSGGLLVYNFGSWLMRYIEETYGSDAIVKFNEVNSSKPLNLLFILGFGENLDRVVKEALGISADELYEGFRGWLRDQFHEEIRRIQTEGAMEALRITTLGFLTDQPAWSPDGEWIAYIHSGPGRSGIRIITPRGEDDREFVAGGLISYPGWSPDGRIVYAKLELEGPYYILSDLYLYDLETRREERLTRGERAYYARFSPDGEKIYFAKNIGRDGSTALAVLDLKTKESRIIKEFPENTGIIHSFALSPDGERIALALWRWGGYQDIYMMPAEGGELLPVTQDEAQAADPVWSPDGQYIIFSSDPDRIYNLYAYRVSDGKFFRVTNMLTGAFHPTISPQGDEIAFVGYSSDGYDLYRIPFDPATWNPVEFPKETIPEWTGYPTTQYPIEPYNPLPLMAPKLWLPIPMPGGAGVFTLGQDPLSKHFYTVMAGWDFTKNMPIYSLSYTNGEITPITLFASGDRSGSTQGVSASLPLLPSMERQQFISLGYERKERWPIPEDGGEEEPDKVAMRPAARAVIIHTISGSYRYMSTLQRDLFRDLLEISLFGEIFTEEGSGKWHNKLILSWREAFRLPLEESHWLRLRAMAGWTDAEDEEEQFRLGGPYGPWVLRGFQSGAFEGRQAISLGLQYDFTLFSVERGLGHWPIFFDDLGLSLFLDAGMARDKLDIAGLKVGFGAEFGLSLTLGYFQQMSLIAGVAQGLGEKRPLFYLNVSLPGLF